MKDVHCIDEPLSFKLPINHGRQTVKLTIDFCQRVASSSEKREEPGGTKKTSSQPQCRSQRGCGKNVAKARGAIRGKNVAKSRGTIPELSCQPEPTSLRIRCLLPSASASGHRLAVDHRFVFTNKHDVYGKAGMPFYKSSYLTIQFPEETHPEKERKGRGRVCQFIDCFQK